MIGVVMQYDMTLSPPLKHYNYIWNKENNRLNTNQLKQQLCVNVGFVLVVLCWYHFVKPTYLQRFHWNFKKYAGNTVVWKKMFDLHSLKLTYPLKMDGWKTTFLFGWPFGRCYVSVREGIFSTHHPGGFCDASFRMALAVVWWILVHHTWVCLDLMTRTWFCGGFGWILIMGI